MRQLQVQDFGKHIHLLSRSTETGGSWNESAIELVQEIEIRISVINEDFRETAFLFQRLFLALQKGKYDLLLRNIYNRMNDRWNAHLNLTIT